MKYKLSTILITLAVIAALLCACYPVMGDDGYRTMPLGTGTDVILLPESTSDLTLPTTYSDTTNSPDNTDAPNTSEDITTSVPDISGDDTTSDDTSPSGPIDYEFEIIKNVTEIGKVGSQKCSATLLYPEIKGISDTEKQKDINELLAQIAQVEYKNRLANPDELIRGGTAVNYTITDTSVVCIVGDVISVRSEGIIDYNDDSKDERFVYCNLIRLSTGKDITLKKTYSDFESIITLFKAGKFEQISGSSTLTSAITLEELIEPYKYHSQYGTYPESYFTKDSLVIVIETDKENGHFAEFEISLEQADGYLIISPNK